MTMQRIYARVLSPGSGDPPNINLAIRWYMSETFQSQEMSAPVDITQDVMTVRQTVRALVAADVSAYMGQTFTADDVDGLDSIVAQHFGFIPISVNMSSLLAVDNITHHPTLALPGVTSYKIDAYPWSVNARVLISGTATLVVKNGAGTTLATKAITSAGVSTFTPSVSTITAGDRFMFGFSGVGIGLGDVSVTGWLKMQVGV